MSPEDAIKRLEAIDGFGQVEAVNDKKDVVRFRWEGDVNTLHIIRHVLVEKFVLQLRLPGDPE